MPPLEAKKVLFQLAAAKMRGIGTKGGRKMKLMFVDVRKAHLNGICTEDIYVELPAEAKAAKGKCGKLKRWLYGTRGASQGWERHYTDNLEKEQFRRGRFSTAVFYNPVSETRLVVHGDDFTFLGYPEELEYILKKMREWYDLKLRGVLGDGPSDEKRMVILNRIIEWDGKKLTYKADPRHAQMIIEAMGLKSDSKSRSAPADKEDEEGEEESEPLAQPEAKKFRGVAARANYLGQDRCDIQHAVRGICRGMARPSKKGQERLRKLARYLVGVPEVVIVFESDGREPIVEIYTDSDWAKCRETRRSTSGGILLFGGSPVKTWSRQQGSVSLSSGEAEYYAMISGAAEGLGLKSLLADLGVDVGLKMWVDSSAAKSIASRMGAGKIRHMAVRHLWLQERVRERELVVRKVEGSRNPADLLTKVRSAADARQLLNPYRVHLNASSP
jgi:hypothetical protein